MNYKRLLYTVCMSALFSVLHTKISALIIGGPQLLERWMTLYIHRINRYLVFDETILVIL